VTGRYSNRLNYRCAISASRTTEHLEAPKATIG
jgi:hypothetical protein